LWNSWNEENDTQISEKSLQLERKKLRFRERMLIEKLRGKKEK